MTGSTLFYVFYILKGLYCQYLQAAFQGKGPQWWDSQLPICELPVCEFHEQRP